MLHRQMLHCLMLHCLIHARQMLHRQMLHLPMRHCLMLDHYMLHRLIHDRLMLVVELFVWSCCCRVWYWCGEALTKLTHTQSKLTYCCFR